MSNDNTEAPDLSAEAWAGMDGAVAWHLIDRHAQGWAQVGEMMNAWLRAKSAAHADH